MWLCGKTTLQFISKHKPVQRRIFARPIQNSMIQYKKRILDNGLTVIAEQDLSTNMCAVNMLYKVGSRNEHPDKTGFAHLFEHLMFGGSKNAPEFDTPLQNAGGENNAFTNTDYTNYYDVVPVQNIETALWLEADRMSGLNINMNSFATQQKVVIEEFKEVCLNKPYGESWHHLSALSYEKHAYNWPTIGKTPDHIETAVLEDVKTFYDRHYQPSNAILAISGPLSTDEIFRLVERYFGDIQGLENNNDVIIPKEPRQLSSRYKLLKEDVPAPLFLLGYHMPERNSESYYACDLLTDILSNGKSARLYTSLVRQKQLFSMIDCYVTGTFDPGLIIVEARPMPGISASEGLAAIEEQFAHLTNNPITERELQKVKNKVVSSLAISDLNVLNKAISMAYFEWLDALDLMNRQEELYEQVTTDNLLKAANDFLRPTNQSMVEYLPLKEQVTA